MTTREPEWTEDDLAELLALAEYRAGLCECCGLPAAQTQEHEAQAPRFVVSKKFCLARRTLAETQAAFFKNRRESPGDAALLWSVRVEKG